MHYRIGQLYLKQGQADADPKAMVEFQEELKINPRSAVANLAMAGIYQYQHQQDQALAKYQLASQMDPTLAEARIGVARILIEQKKFNDAEMLLNTLVKEVPRNAQAHYAVLELSKGPSLSLRCSYCFSQASRVADKRPWQPPLQP
jgi:cellulose synthase operon protein C